MKIRKEVEIEVCDCCKHEHCRSHNCYKCGKLICWNCSNSLSVELHDSARQLWRSGLSVIHIKPCKDCLPFFVEAVKNKIDELKNIGFQ